MLRETRIKIAVWLLKGLFELIAVQTDNSGKCNLIMFAKEEGIEQEASVDDLKLYEWK